MQWLAGIIVDKIISKLIAAFSSLVAYAVKKFQRNKNLDDNKKKLDEAIASGDKDAISQAGEDSLNNIKR